MSTKTPPPLSYGDSGVDIERGERLVGAIRPLMNRTMNERCLTALGGFGGLYELPASADGTTPVLVAGCDGVGTKLTLACALNRHDDIGIDLVAMCVNDILAHGARPLFFLDYYASGRLHEQTFVSVVGGICRGCEQAGCALLGGESAEMPGMYGGDEYDLAGFAVGMVNKDAIVDGAAIGAGDVLLGLASSGVHANGFSLIRAILERGRLSPAQPCADATLGEALLKPTRIYVRSVLRVLERVPLHGIAHITGGGIPGNLARILPPGIGARLHAAQWPQPPEFALLAQAGNIERAEMYRTFNCGLGMVLAVAPADAAAALAGLEECGESATTIGETVAIGTGDAVVVID